MHLEYAHNCQSHFVHQARYRTEQFIYSWVCYCKTSRVQYQQNINKMQLLSSWSPINLSTVPHGLQLFLVLQQNTHGTAPTGFALAAFACITVRLWAVNALRIWPHYIVTDSPSKKVLNQQVYCWVCYCKPCSCCVDVLGFVRFPLRFANPYIEVLMR